ncbi:MAG: cytosine permease [Chloroflexota bacterium]|nr:cytosine permease [Dehalococcoidia bacterium]MDW8254004.1 cytosine permease [Chloroflexota bacterium]
MTLLAADATPERSVAPVPPSRRVLGLWETFVLWADLGVSFLVMVVGMFLVPGLGLAEAIAAIVIGAVIGNALLGLAAAIGAETGAPTMVLLRAVLGIRGSYLPTALNILQLIGWASLEVIVMAQAAETVATRFLGMPAAYPLWVAIFTAITLAMALSGPIAVIKKYLARIAIWAVLASVLWITGALITSFDLGAALRAPGTGTLSFWLAVDLVVAMPISWFPLVADYSRFTRSHAAAFWGTSLGYFVPHVWFYLLGAMLVVSAGVVSDPAAPIAPLLAGIAGLTAGWLALLALLVGETDEAFANLYSTAVSVQNLFPRANQRVLLLIGGGIVLLVALVVPLVQYESFLLLIGAAFIPLLGVLLADYFVLRGRHYQSDALFAERGPYWYQGGLNWAAIIVWGVGAASYLLIAGLPAAGVSGLAPWLGASLPSFLLAFGLYTIVGRLVPAKE